VELNRDKQSDFVTEWLSEETDAIKPVYANLETGISRTKIGKADLHYVKNMDNRLFTFSYIYGYGRNHNKTLPFIAEYLKYVGIPGMNAEQISKKMYSLGCNYSAGIGEKNTTVTITGPEENFDAALNILEQLLNNAMINEKAFADMVAGELKRRSDAKLNSRAIAGRLNAYAMYGADNPSKWILSNEELKNLKATDLVTLIRELKSNPHEVFYYGQRDMESLKNTVAAMHKMQADFETVPAPRVFIPRDNKESEVYFADYKQVQASIYWLNKGGIYNPADEPMVAAFNQYFGGDMSSVVFQNIREAKALAYSTFAGFSVPVYKDRNYTSMAFIGTQADKFHDAIAAMNDLLNKMPADENVFALAKESLKNRIETGRTLDESLLETYLALRDKGLSSDPNKQLYEALPKMTLADIEKFHRNNIAKRKWAMAVVASKEKISRKDLERYGKVTELSLEEIFGF
jgi:predicted Zn-dependent peptidase